MKNKVIIIILFILFTISISCGIYGFILNKQISKNPSNTETPNKTTNKIVYNYYLENEPVLDIPTNPTITNEDGTTTIDTKYIFKKYTCTNDITGSFNTDSWNFVIENDKKTEGTCDLYFVKAKYDVTFTLTNAIEDENNIKNIDRETDGKFVLIPNDGYTFKDAICSNNKEAQWDSTTNTLIISAIMSDISCQVNFERKQLKANIVVKNGSGNTTETVYYGDSKTIFVEPNDGYKDAKISCTNKQTATFDNNTIIFDKLTSDTTCTITFQKIAMVNHKLIVSNPTEYTEITLISDTEQAIETGKEGKIILRSTDGSTPTLSCGDNIPTSKELESQDSTKTIEFSFYNMSNDITCQIIK